MDSKYVDKLNLDINRFFDFDNHNHVRHSKFWKRTSVSLK